MVYVNVYSGSGENNWPLNLTTQIDANGDGDYDDEGEFLGEEEMNIKGNKTATLYWLNDHCFRVYSDYQVWYDVTDLITSNQVSINVASEQTGSDYDGRIKLIALVVAYNDGDNDQVHYWVLNGQDWFDSGSSTSTFNTDSFNGVVEDATLNTVALSSNDGTYSFNGNSVAGNLTETDTYYKEHQWNVSGYITPGSDSTLQYNLGSGSFKMNLATLAIREVYIPQMDLTISGDVLPQPNLNTNDVPTIFARESNTIRLTVINNGADTSPATEVEVVSSDGFTGRGTIPSLASGATATIDVIDTTLRNLAGGMVTYTVTLDPDNRVDEVNETNNVFSSAAMEVRYNGYKGKQYWDGTDNITTQRVYDLNGDVIYSSGDSSYQGGGWTDYTVNWTAENLVIPVGATIKEAWLYIPYNWDQASLFPDNVAVTFNDQLVNYLNWYHDQSNFGTWCQYEYGMLSFNVTSLFQANGNNNATLSRSGSSSVAMYPFNLMVVYEDAASTRKQIFINEGWDLLGTSSSYATTSDEVVAYAPFTGMNIDTSVDTATLHSFMAGAQDNEGKLLFNGVTVDENAWNGTSKTAEATLFDVTDYLNTNGNVAAIQGTSSTLNAMQQVLVLEYGADLVVTDISPNSGVGGYLFANEPNVFSVTVNNTGSVASPATTMEVEINGNTYTVEVPALDAGASTTVTVTDNTLYTGGNTVPVNANADPSNNIPETNETNNLMTTTFTVCNNGYKGKQYTDDDEYDSQETQQTFTGTYDVIYSSGNTAYTGSGWTAQTYTWTNTDLAIPEGATVVSARLYQGYTYNQMGVDPAWILNFNGNIINTIATYSDTKGFGSYNYPYGLYVYDVTSFFNTAGNTMTITPEEGQNYGIYGAYLIVVYQDPDTTSKTIYINDGFDMLCSRSGYSVSDEEATAYADYQDVSTTDLNDAKVIAILASAGDENNSKFFFNGQEYTGFWNDYKGSTGEPQTGFSVYDVTDDVVEGLNTAALQSYDSTGTSDTKWGDNMYAMTTILVAEYLPDLVVTDISPNAGVGDNLFANEPNIFSVTVNNTGSVASPATTMEVEINGNTYTVEVPALDAGASTTVTVTDNTLYTADDNVPVSANADPSNNIPETNETNNQLTTTLTVYNNGYKGKQYTDDDEHDSQETQQVWEGTYDVVYSSGNTAYTGSGWTAQTYTWTSTDLAIPEGATVVSARLYQGYTYNKMEVDPNWTLIFNGNTLSTLATYSDIKGFGSYNYPYGLYVYDVTSIFNTAGNTMTITPEEGQNYGIYGAYLIVVYQDPDTDNKTIYINDGFDMLCSRYTYSVSDEEATAYANYQNVNTDHLGNAQVIAILASANEENDSKFFFNEHEYTGFWNDYMGDPQIGFSVYDVTSNVVDGLNTAGLQSYDSTGSGDSDNGDNMYAMTTILVTTMDTEAPVVSADLAEGTYNVPQSVTLTATDNWDPSPVIYYTLDGSDPTSSSAQYTGVIDISSTTTLKFMAVDAAGNTSPVHSVTYTIPNADVYINSWVSNNNPQLGDLITMTFKIGNNGPDAATGVVFTYVIPDSFEYVNMTFDSEPEPVYDPVTRTLTWNLGDLPVGDPTLSLVLRVIGTVASTSSPTILSTTYDPISGNNAPQLTVNPQSPVQTGAATSTTISAATSESTIPMQTTGAPLVGLILGVLSILGGLGIVVNKRS